MEYSELIRFLISYLLFMMLIFACGMCKASVSPKDRPVFTGYAYVDVTGYDFPEDLQQIAGGKELFTINYSPLDQLGRPGMVSAIITKDSVSGQRRDGITQIVPTGFEQARYPFIDQEYLYQRCHLVGSQFKVDTEIPENIVTGTHYLNLNGMYSIENQVAAYVLASGNSVYYCAIPDFEGDELVCRGIIIAAVSLPAPEEFKIAEYCFNVEPGVVIDYSTGYSMLAETAGTVEVPWTERTIVQQTQEQNYILNIKSLKFHYPNCSGVSTMKEHNKQEFYGSRDTLIEMGYSPCGICNP